MKKGDLVLTEEADGLQGIDHYCALFMLRGTADGLLRMRLVKSSDSLEVLLNYATDEFPDRDLIYLQSGYDLDLQLTG